MRKVPSRKVEDADINTDFTKTINLEKEEAIIPQKSYKPLELNNLPSPKEQATAVSLETIHDKK